MEEKKNNNILLGILIAIVIFGLGALGGYYYQKVTQKDNKQNGNQNKPVETNEKTSEEDYTKSEEDYTKYVGKNWADEDNTEWFNILSIENESMKFSWSRLRLGGVDAELPFKDGKTVFYYNGYEDSNYNAEEDEGEHFYRKGIIELKDNKVYISLEAVTKEEFENNLSLDVTDSFGGGVYFELGEYVYEDRTFNHPVKYEDAAKEEIWAFVDYLNLDSSKCKIDPAEHLYNYNGGDIIKEGKDFMEYYSTRFYSCYHGVEYVDTVGIGYGGHLLMTPSQYEDYQKYYNYTLMKYDDVIAEDDYFGDEYEMVKPYLNQNYYTVISHGDGYGYDQTKYEIVEMGYIATETYGAKIKATLDDGTEYIGTFTVTQADDDYLIYSPMYFEKQ